ncbi:MAG TPA: class I SAM-dependent methyltransferase [Dyella sp.]|uniref:class I SAM-dependent methyltransferase n=1 Tax=Dyella sp. TaxID=1869338 RepID=UPI002F91F2A6
MKLKFISRIYANIARHAAEHIATNIDHAFQVEARDSSAQFVRAHMPDAARFPTRDSLLLDAVRRSAALGGCICEFGVFQGHTLRLMADAAPERTVHGFDSFEGLPSHWRSGYGKGAFKTQVPAFRQSNVQLHVGLFEDTLGPFLEKLQPKISLAHIDCDIYPSAKFALQRIAPYLADGAIVVFDEYFNYPGWQEHEHKALEETIGAGLLSVQYLAFVPRGEQVMLETRQPG